jgi:hypothetical protein
MISTVITKEKCRLCGTEFDYHLTASCISNYNNYDPAKHHNQQKICPQCQVMHCPFCNSKMEYEINKNDSRIGFVWKCSNHECAWSTYYNLDNLFFGYTILIQKTFNFEGKEFPLTLKNLEQCLVWLHQLKEMNPKTFDPKEEKKLEKLKTVLDLKNKIINDEDNVDDEDNNQDEMFRPE